MWGNIFLTSEILPICQLEKKLRHPLHKPKKYELFILPRF